MIKVDFFAIVQYYSKLEGQLSWISYLFPAKVISPSALILTPNIQKFKEGNIHVFVHVHFMCTWS